MPVCLWEWVNAVNAVNATGRKPFYYSENRDATQIGYSPRYDSLEGIIKEVGIILQMI